MTDGPPSETDEEKRRRGEVGPEILLRLKQGSVWIAGDQDAIAFPEERLPSAGARHRHPTRRVILVQQDGMSRRSSVRTVLVVPCTTKWDNPMPWDLALEPDGTLFTERAVALCRLVQPILKVDLRKHLGQLPPVLLGELRARLEMLLGAP